MKVALIDDEPYLQETVKTILLNYFPHLEIKQASGVVDGIKLVSDFVPDLIFLDIEMGDGTGFDLLTRLPEISFALVFITAHDSYAIKAFKFSAMDYILKPVNPIEIKKAVEKVLANEISTPKPQILDTFFHNQKNGEFNRILLSDASNIYMLELNELIRCVAANNYTHFFLVDGREIVISKTLKYYDDLLKGTGFFRIHQSHIINLKHLIRYDKKEGGEVVMKDGSIVPVSLRKRADFFIVLKEFKS